MGPERPQAPGPREALPLWPAPRSARRATLQRSVAPVGVDSSRAQRPCPEMPSWGALPPRTGSSAFPNKEPKGKMTGGVRGTGQSLGHSACGWHPVGCQLTKGTSLFPTQSWQDSRLVLLQPQPAENMFPAEPWATGQSTGDIPQRRGWREGAGRAPRLAHCGGPPRSADWRFSRLAPCGPDGPSRHCRGAGRGGCGE